MPKEKAVYGYFLNGFSFFNKNIEIYLVLVALNLVTTLLPVQAKSIFGLIFLLMSIVVTVFQQGYTMSVPVFLAQKKNGKNLSYKYIRDITLQVTKRLIVPALIFALLFVLYIIAFIIVASAISNGDVEKMKAINQQLQNWIRHPNYLGILPFSLIFSFFSFFSIFFSLKKYGFISSIKKSITFSFKNLRFVILAFLISIVSGYVIRAVVPGTLLESQVGLKWWSFLYQSLSMYPSLVVTASALLYYQDHQKA